MSVIKRKSQAIQSVLDTEEAQLIINKSADLSPLLKEAVKWWNFDIYTRRPGPALDEDSVFVGTDLDIASFLFSMWKEGNVINIPKYKNLRQKTSRNDEIITSSENRHGKITGLTSNEQVFTFGVRIFDSNVMSATDVGGFRTFLITDFDGNFYDGLKSITFIPTEKQKAYIAKHGLAIDNTIYFKNFVHPERWRSIYGQYYFLTKMLLARMKDEASWYFKEIKAMQNEGIELPPEYIYPSSDTERGPKKSVKTKSYTFEIDSVPYKNQYTYKEHTVDTLVEYTLKRRDYVYSTGPALRFAARACELAFIKNGNMRVPHWFANREWQSNFKRPRERNTWNRFVMHQPKVGEFGLALRFREHLTSQEIAEDVG